MFESKAERLLIPDDLSDTDLDELAGAIAEVDDPEFRARIGDILWLRRRDALIARETVRWYLASGDRLVDPQEFSWRLERYERAVRLARQLGPKGELVQECLSHIAAEAATFPRTDLPPRYLYGLLELLVEFRFGDFRALSIVSNSYGLAALGDGNFPSARGFFDITAKLLSLVKDPDAAEAARVRSAESFVAEAEAREAGGSFMSARSFWEDAIRSHKDRPSLRERIPELQGRLKIAARRSLDEMHSFDHELDIREAVEESVRSFKDLLLDDALFRFATAEPLIDPKKLRQEILDEQGHNPLISSFEAEIFDEAGRKVAVRPALLGGDPAKAELAIEGFMDQGARWHRNLVVHARLVPALQTICDEHTISEDEIKRLVSASPLIPEGRTPLFVKAIIEGLRWDFSTALHIFIPQIENGLRNILHDIGVVPEYTDNNGIEQVWGFERILTEPLLKQALGEGTIYELRSLLVERLGSNFRNSLAHGLLSVDALKGETAFYLWWLLFRMTLGMTPGLKAYLERRRAEKADDGRPRPSAE